MLVVSNGDGIHSEDEFKDALDRLEAVNPKLRENIDNAINYALENNMDGEAESRYCAWHTMLREGAWEITSLARR